MKISVLGTGDVGQTLAAALVEKGHEVMIGTRDVDEKLSEKQGAHGSPPFSEWFGKHEDILLGTFQESASFGELVINATNGANSLNALDLAGEENLEGKVLIDVSNPLDFSKGMPPTLLDGVNNSNSLAEEIQKEFPGTRVVKTFNTMWCGLMVNPGMIGNGNHVNYICGNDESAKREVKSLIKELGWKDESIIDLGDLTGARGMEAYLLLWVRLWGTVGTGAFNLGIVK
ncbi:MAG TPA: NAD(P)-binding domain-containing protein [Bacteroidales bacterium]|nr:NAD(P)-binding domain-containing protein [Bacteroidales bacterium]